MQPKISTLNHKSDLPGVNSKYFTYFKVVDTYTYSVVFSILKLKKPYVYWISCHIVLHKVCLKNVLWILYVVVFQYASDTSMYCLHFIDFSLVHIMLCCIRYTHSTVFSLSSFLLQWIWWQWSTSCRIQQPIRYYCPS